MTAEGPFSSGDLEAMGQDQRANTGRADTTRESPMSSGGWLANRGAVGGRVESAVDDVTTVWPQALVQACVLHLIRNTFRYASRRYWEQMARDLRPVYTAATEQAAEARFTEFAEVWGGQYPAIVSLWRAAWSEFVPFLDYGACCDIGARPLVA